jgi:hypothetical protein
MVSSAVGAYEGTIETGLAFFKVLSETIFTGACSDPSTHLAYSGLRDAHFSGATLPLYLYWGLARAVNRATLINNKVNLNKEKACCLK